MKIIVSNRSNTRVVNVLSNKGKSVRCMLTPMGNDKLLLAAIGRLKRKYALTDKDLFYDI